MYQSTIEKIFSIPSIAGKLAKARANRYNQIDCWIP